MKRIMLFTVALLAGATTLAAQTRRPAPEIRPFAGINVPTGSARDLFKIGPLFGLQVGVEAAPALTFVGSFGWTPGQNKYQVLDAGVNMLQYDAGLELAISRPLAGKWSFKPFIGAGGGARTYLFHDVGLSNKTCTLGYGALGAEFQLGQTAMRFEARDNLFCYRSPIAGIESKTRNDIGLSLGVAYHLR